MSAPAATRPVTPGQLERDLLRRLGLDSSASPEDLETAHEAVLGFLGQAPRQLRAWARAQAAGADEAYALLSDPAALARSAALVGAAGRPAPLPGGPATPPVRRETPRPAASARAAATGQRSNGEDGQPVLSDDEFDALFAEVTPSAHREMVTGGTPGKRAASRATNGLVGVQAPVQGSPLRRMATIAVGVVLGGAVLFSGAVLLGVYHPGGGSALAASAPSATPVPSGALDEAAVTALMQRYQANPKDFSTLMSLGNAFYSAQDFANAASWFKQAAAVDATSIDALLALGAASFNSNNTATAEASWKQAAVLDPKNVEAHYDLGYLYFSKSPQDIAGVQREWNKVIALDPNSDTATQVKAHLATLGSPAPSGSAGAAASPTASSAPGSATPAGSPTASAAPAASPAASPASGASGAPSPSAAPTAAGSGR